MRAPGEAPGVFALESAIDELAVNLGIDPLDMRLRNYADSDEYERRPWSSKHLRECYLRAAERFGWSQRKADPKSMRNKDGQLIGWGMATAVYPAIQMPASVRVILDRKGEAVLQSATHEIGTGTYTAMTQLAAEALGLSLEQVHFELGDSEYPEAPANGGSWLTASVGAAVIAACNRLKQQLISLASESSSAPFFGKQVIVDQGKIRLKDQPSQSLSYSELLDLNNLPQIAAEQGAKPGEERERFSFQSFGSIFVEVKVDSEIRQVHVSRAVGVYDVGHIINPRLARSQLLGGITFGIGMALLEQSIPDPRIGRIVNANLAEYHVPVCTDIPTQFDVDFLGVPDPYMNAPGARGIGEIGIVGTPAAIANAIYHATGKRIRELPITLDKLT
jgi:xanthine dehydrogenase YagR molybdenum-binding subunit